VKLNTITVINRFTITVIKWFTMTVIN
jgi:hypothetical protein